MGSIGGIPGVSDLTVRAVDADQLSLHFRSHGGLPALTRALAAEHLRGNGNGTDGTLQLRYQGSP